MPANVAELDDTQAEIAPPLEGRVNLKLVKVSAQAKGGDARATMFTLQFEADNGDRLRTNLNFYGSPQTEKQIIANRISFNGTIIPLARLAKMDPDTVSKSASGIAEFLNAVEGSLYVSAYVKDDNGFPKPGSFQEAVTTTETAQAV